MTYLAVWLLAVAAGDLVRPGAEPTRRRSWPTVALVGSGVLVTAWALAGLGGGPRLLVLAAGSLLQAAWAWTSTHALATPQPGEGRAPSRHRPWALAALATGVVVGFALAGVDPPVAGWLGGWWRSLGLPRLAPVPAGRALMVLAVVLAQVGTANVVVRLVLDAAGARRAPGVLRGGRWLGPMERVFLVGLALAGQATAASVVVAAKGLLRFPEIQDQRGPGQRIDEVTEYFLLGSFTSWMVALASVLLAL